MRVVVLTVAVLIMSAARPHLLRSQVPTPVGLGAAHAHRAPTSFARPRALADTVTRGVRKGNLIVGSGAIGAVLGGALGAAYVRGYCEGRERCDVFPGILGGAAVGLLLGLLVGATLAAR